MAVGAILSNKKLKTNPIINRCYIHHIKKKIQNSRVKLGTTHVYLVVEGVKERSLYCRCERKRIEAILDKNCFTLLT